MRVIQMGMGGMGGAWMRQLQPLKTIEQVAFVEINAEIAQEQAEKFALDPDSIFGTLDAALAQVEADGVIAVIPPDYRIQTLRTCIAAGLPLLTEKPLASSMADAESQVKLANDSGLLCMVAQNYRYRPVMQTIKQILDSGELGRITSITVEHYRGLSLGGFRGEMSHPLLQDMSIHHFDLLRFFLGTVPSSILAQSWNPVWTDLPGKRAAFVWLTFPDAVRVSYSASWVSQGQPTTFDGNWRFECEHGVLILQDDVISVGKRDKLDGSFYSFSDPEIRPHVTMAHTDQAYLAQEFRAAVLDGKPPVTTCQDNIKSLQMVFDAVESSESGQVVQR